MMNRIVSHDACLQFAVLQRRSGSPNTAVRERVDGSLGLGQVQPHYLYLALHKYVLKTSMVCL